MATVESLFIAFRNFYKAIWKPIQKGQRKLYSAAFMVAHLTQFLFLFLRSPDRCEKCTHLFYTKRKTLSSSFDYKLDSLETQPLFGHARPQMHRDSSDDFIYWYVTSQKMINLNAHIEIAGMKRSRIYSMPFLPHNINRQWFVLCSFVILLSSLTAKKIRLHEPVAVAIRVFGSNFQNSRIVNQQLWKQRFAVFVPKKKVNTYAERVANLWDHMILVFKAFSSPFFRFETHFSLYDVFIGSSGIEVKILFKIVNFFS